MSQCTLSILFFYFLFLLNVWVWYMDTHGEYTHLCAHLKNPEETGYPALPLCALPLETAITQPGAGLVAQAPEILVSPAPQHRGYRHTSHMQFLTQC